MAASRDHQYLVMRCATTSAHVAAILQNATTIESFEQLQRKFTKLEEEFLEAPLEPDLRGSEMEDLNTHRNSKALLTELYKAIWIDANEGNKIVVAKLGLVLDNKDIQYNGSE